MSLHETHKFFLNLQSEDRTIRASFFFFVFTYSIIRLTRAQNTEMKFKKSLNREK